MMTFRALLLCGLAATPSLHAQDQRTGRIVGRVIDEAGHPVPGAQIGLATSSATTTAGIDGRYTLLNIVPGVVALSVRAIGFSPKTVSGVVVPEGGVVSQDIVLTAQTMEVEGISVTSEAERGTVAAALDEQRNAAGVVNAITAEQIARSPDSDAGQAVQRVSGVTVQDGRYVFVRGLGERYTTTSLNGARLPSPEPEKKVVPLDLFPSNLLEAITTSKTFTPDQPGDFSGAQVNLRTREFPLRRQLTLSTGFSANTAVTGENVVRAPSDDLSPLGSAGATRRMPALLRSAPANLSGLSQSQINSIIGSFRNQWTSRSSDGGPNGSLSLSLGGEDPLFGRLIGYAASLTYAYNQEARADEQRAVALPTSVPGELLRRNAYTGSTGRTSVLWGGILNLSTRLGSTTRLDWNNTFTRTADNEAVRLAGFNHDANEFYDVTRLTFVARSALSSQLRGTHQFGRHGVEWAGSFSRVSRDEPDRSDLVYVTSYDSATGASQPILWTGGPRSGARAFAEIDERSGEGTASYRLNLDQLGRRTLKVGAFGRATRREADSRVYDIINLGLTTQQRTAPAESIMANYAGSNSLSLFANANAGRYTATDVNAGGYAMVELPVGQRVRLIGGARVERADIQVRTRTIDGRDTTSNLENTDVLPSLGATIALTPSMNLRLSASQTLSRPEYRELSPVTWFDIIGGARQFGNASLRRALIRNFDARWEWYPRAGEVVSVGLFAKDFDDPIERVMVQTSDGITPDATFLNADGAVNYGIEFDVRRSLDIIAPALLPFAVFSNLTLMRSEIRTAGAGSSPTNPDRAMVGQAPYVVNMGLVYTHPRSDFSATVLFNRVGRRIVEAGIQPYPDAYEEARSLLDLSVQLPLAGRVSARMDLKNLLDAPYRVSQGNIDRLSYRSGRVLGVGLRWNP